MSGRIFDNCQRFQLSDQISDIFHQILPIEISIDDIFKIMPTRMYLFSHLNIVKPVCKDTTVCKRPQVSDTDGCLYM